MENNLNIRDGYYIMWYCFREEMNNMIYNEQGKARVESLTIMTELVLPNDTNVLGNLLGGRLLHWIDIAGALTATRHSDGLVATITMDMVEFKCSVKMGDIVTLTSYVTWTGRTSLETAVEVYSENPMDGTRQRINKVYLVFVCLDRYAKKRPVVPFLPLSDNEIAEFERAKERKKRRLEHTNA